MIQVQNLSDITPIRRSRDRWTPLTLINGQLWNQVTSSLIHLKSTLLNQAEVVKYMKTIFMEEHLINNLPEKRRESGEEVKVKEVLESLTGRTNWTEASVLEAKAKIEEYCLQP